MLFVFDLDGVIYRGDTAVPGAAAALERLRGRGDSLFYLTNNSTRSRADYAAKLTRLGIPTGPEQIMTSAYATGLYLREHGGEGRSVYVVGEGGLAEEMRLAGLRVLPDHEVPPQFGGPAEAAADFVVAGLNRHLTYAQLARAQWHIGEGARFIATNRDATYPLEDNVEIPGGGAIIGAIEGTVGPAECTIGKPEPYTWLEILTLAGVPPHGAVMVGDRPETDIFGARRVGLQTVLVLTGVTGPAEVAGLPLEQRPDHVIDSVVELPELFG